MADRKYLDETGLSTFWTKVKSLFPVLTGVSSVAGNANSGSYLSVRWYVSGANGVTAPYDGMRIMVKIPRAGVGTAGAVLSLNGNTAADYHPVAYNINTVFTTHYAVDSYKIFVYDANASMACYLTSNTKTTVTGVWKGEANYDSNTTTTYGTLDYYFRPYAGQALSRYKLVALDKDNRVVPISNELYQGEYASTTTYSKDQIVTVSGVYYKSLQNSNKNHAPATSTSYWQTVTPFTATTAAFKPEKIWFFNSTGNIAVGGVIGAQTLVEVGYSTAMFTYNFTGTGTAYRMVYLKGTYNRTTGLFTLDNTSTTSYFTLVPCNTANITLSSYFVSGADYILVGGIYTTTNYMSLFAGNPMFRFDGTNLVPYDTYNAKRVENLIPTTASQVGALPDSTAYLASATTSGNTLTITPSSGTAITYTPSFTSAVTSVNNQTGAVTLTASDVGALASTTTYVSSVNGSSGAITNVAVTNADNQFSAGQTISGDVILYKASGDSPRLTFQRGTLTDTYNDWSFYDSGGLLYIQQRGSGSSAWETRATLTQTVANFAGTLQQGGVNVVTTSGSQDLTNKTYNGYTLGAACAKAVSTTVTANDTNLVTGGAVVTWVNTNYQTREDDGLQTNSGNIVGAINELNAALSNIPTVGIIDLL